MALPNASRARRRSAVGRDGEPEDSDSAGTDDQNLAPRIESHFPEI